MNEIQPSQWNSDMSNVTCSEEYYHGISAAETIILPSLIGIICSTGLVGNVLVMITIISEFSPYKMETRDCVIDLIQKRETKSTTPAAVSLSNLLQNCYYLPEHLSKMMQSRSWMLPDGFSKVREKLLNKSRKKSIPDIYICNLAVADLVHITGMPFLIHQWARGGEWVFGSPLCTIITSLDTCNQFACSAIMTVMSLDRYLALVQPFRLTSLRTRSKTIRVNLCLWAISLILVFPVWTYSKVITFKDGLESCAFDLTSPEEVLWYTLYLTIATFFFPLPLIMVCYILILRYTWELYQENKQAGCYNTGIPRQRLIRLTKMVLVLVGVFVLSIAPYHVLQLVNLRVAQPTPAFYISYYFSICLSYASGSINPFLYILLSGNFQKRLRQCMNVKVKMIERDVNNIETTPKSSF